MDRCAGYGRLLTRGRSWAFRALLTVSAIAGFSVAFGAAASAVASPAKGEPATGDLVRISCPTSSLCYAVGSYYPHHNGGSKSTGVIDTIKGAKQVGSKKLTGTEDLIDISCPTSKFCAITGDDGQGSFVATWSGTRITKLVHVRWALRRVSCPAANKCVVAGISGFVGIGGKLEAATFLHGKLGKPSLRKVPNVRGANPLDLSCPSTSACEVVGQASSGGSLRSFYAGLGSRAKVGTIHVPPGDPLTYTVACQSTSAGCYLGGDYPPKGDPNGDDGKLLSLKIGGGTLNQVANTVTIPNALSCQTLKLCTAAGVWGDGGGAAVVSYTNGRPGTEEWGYDHFPNVYSFTSVARVSASRWVALDPEAKATYIYSGAVQ